MLVKGLAVIGVIFPIGGACSLVERKISAWMQGRPGPNRAIPFWFAWVPVLGPFLQRLGVFHLMADGGKMFFKEDPVPGPREQVLLHARAGRGDDPRAHHVTVVPFGAYLDGAASWCRCAGQRRRRHPRGLRGFVARRLLAHPRRLGLEFEISLPRRRARLGAAHLLRAVDDALGAAGVPLGQRPGRQRHAEPLQGGGRPSRAGLSWHGAWFIFYMPVSAVVFLVSLFAETNRLPFDMAEGEADLVGGFHTEYGSMKWGLFFVAEYSHMLVGSGVFILLFLGGWNPLPWLPLADCRGLAAPHEPAASLLGLLSIAIFLGKTLFFIFVFMWVRWTVPRFRYDQVMKLGWQKLLPLAIGNLFYPDLRSRARVPHRVPIPDQVIFVTAMAYVSPTSSNANPSRSPSALPPADPGGHAGDVEAPVPPNVTLEYPEQRPAIPPGYRGVPDAGDGPERPREMRLLPALRVRLPAQGHPHHARARSRRRSPTAHVEKAPQAFDIDMLRCIYCGLCQEVCPEEAIFLQNQYSMTGYTRAEMVNNKARLYELGGTLPDQHFKWDKKKAAAEHGNEH
jgi:NADH-quinone oxidoreductase subunit H